MGPFVGAVSGYDLGAAMGGYDSWDNVRLRSQFEIGARLGFGLEGLLTASMDGQIWVQASMVADAVQLDLGCSTCPYPGRRTEPALPRVPAPLSLAAVFQVGFGVEFPQNQTVLRTGAPYDLGTSWVVYLRFRLDARKYFGGSSD